MPTESERLAAHESGHVLAAYRFGLRVRAVIIEPELGASGGVWYLRFPKHDYSMGTAEENLPFAQQDICVLLAGYLAEEICFGDVEPTWSGFDKQQVDQVAVYALANLDDYALINAGQADKKALREIDWAKWPAVNALRDEVEADTRAYLTGRKAQIEKLAAGILANGGRCWLNEIHAILDEGEEF